MEKTLLELIDLRAKKLDENSSNGGHFTIMKFSTHYKAMWGTPNLNDGSGRDEVRNLQEYETLEDCLVGLLTD